MQTWNAQLCHCQREGKTTTVVSVVDEGGPAAHSLWYAILDVIRETHTALLSLGGSSPEKQDMTWCNISLEGLERWGKWGEGRKNPWEMKTFVFILDNGARGDFKSRWDCRWIKCWHTQGNTSIFVKKGFDLCHWLITSLRFDLKITEHKYLFCQNYL